MQTGVDSSEGTNFFSLGRIEPSRRKRANHLNLLKPGGNSISKTGSGQPERPKVAETWHSSFFVDESNLGGGSERGSEILQRGAAYTGSHSGSIAVTPKIKIYFTQCKRNKKSFHERRLKKQQKRKHFLINRLV